MKRFKTILKLSNPDGAVMVNENYEPEGNLKRYERRCLDGSVMICDHDLDSAREAFNNLSRSPNMNIKFVRYELIDNEWRKIK